MLSLSIASSLVDHSCKEACFHSRQPLQARLSAASTAPTHSLYTHCNCRSRPMQQERLDCRYSGFPASCGPVYPVLFHPQGEAQSAVLTAMSQRGGNDRAAAGLACKRNPPLFHTRWRSQESSLSTSSSRTRKESCLRRELKSMLTRVSARVLRAAATELLLARNRF